MSQSSSSDLATRLREESERLRSEFRDVAAPETVSRCVNAALAEIAQARIADFAPIFFVRRARRLLRDAVTRPA